MGGIKHDISSPEKYANDIFEEIYRMLRNRKIHSNFRDKTMMKKLISTL